MATVHDEIDNWLAADLYGELSDEEQRELHTHLVECAACRKTHQETKTMNKILEETLAQQKPDPAFEQRMLAGFRNRIPERTGLIKLLADLMRLRAAQVTAVAAVLLGLVQLGRMITRETATTPRARDRYANEQLFEQPSQVAATSEPGRAGALDKSDELAAGKPKDLALQHRRNQPLKPDQNWNETSKLPATVPPAKTAQAEMACKGKVQRGHSDELRSGIKLSGNACSGGGQSQTDSQRELSNSRSSALTMRCKRSRHLRTKNAAMSRRQIRRNRQMENCAAR